MFSNYLIKISVLTILFLNVFNIAHLFAATNQSNVFYIDKNTSDPAQVLADAVKIAGAQITIEPTLEINLDCSPPYQHIDCRIPLKVNQGVTISGGRDSTKLGAMIYMDAIGERPEMILIEGDDVTIRDLRLRGPDHSTFNNYDDEPTSPKYRGVIINSKHNILIENNELYGWSNAAVLVKDNQNRITRHLNDKTVKIYSNFIHHNQYGGFGLGIVTDDGAYADIQKNVFDHNRHAIASTGEPGTGYFAHKNLKLIGGGFGHSENPNAKSSAFDMHGTIDCNGHRNCGPAGEYVEIKYNSFQFTRSNAFKHRGTPSEASIVESNTFAHSSINDAVVQNDSEVEPHVDMTVVNNQLDYNAYNRYAVCDFDGDDKDDLFMAAGQTWWYSSGGQREWRYLNFSSVTIENIAVGYFDDDNKCDIFRSSNGKWYISSGGVGSWKSVGTSGYSVSQLRFADLNGDGKTDILRQSNGRWLFAALGIHGWKYLNGPGDSLTGLQFADMNNDGVDDIVTRQNDTFYVSYRGNTTWYPLVSSSDIDSYQLADIDGNGQTDIIASYSSPYYVPCQQQKIIKISLNGTNAFDESLRAKDCDELDSELFKPISSFYFGRFSGSVMQEGLVLDDRRQLTMLRNANTFFTYGLYSM